MIDEGGVKVISPVDVEEAVVGSGVESSLGGDVEDGEYGMRRVKQLKDPKLPTRAEREEHEVSHLPYRSWCRICVMGKGKEDAHRHGGHESDITTVHMDYGFLGGKESEEAKLIPMIVAKDADTKTYLGAVVPKKGSTGEYATKRVLAFLKELGVESMPVVFKTDQEPAIIALVDDIIARRGAVKTLVEQSPKGSPQSNGVSERAVQTIKDHARTIKIALEERLGIQLDEGHRIIPWLVDHATSLVNRCQVGSDGKTSFERLRGRQARIPGFEFGEKVLWRKSPTRRGLQALESVWADGVYLGYRWASGEHVIGDSNGVWKTRTAQRRPYEERWSVETLEWIGGVPWHVREGDPDADGLMDQDELVKVIDGKRRADGLPDVPIPRRFHIAKGDLDKYGYSKGCPGCISVLRGTQRQQHSVACRGRLEKAMKDVEKVQAATKRETEYFEKVLEAESKRQKTDTKVVSDAQADEAMVDDKVIMEERGEKREATVDEGLEQMNETESVTAKRVKNMHELDEEMRCSDEGDTVEEPDAKQRRLDIVEIMHVIANDDMDEVSVKRALEMDMVSEELGLQNELWDEVAYDDVTGKVLDPLEVKNARREEVQFLKEKGIVAVVPYDECFKEGKVPITVRWVDVVKGTMDDPVYRCRLVARDFKGNDDSREDFFAAMPPLEAKKVLFAMAASQRGRVGPPLKLMFIDVKKAHLYGKCTDEVFIELPKEYGEKKDMCGKLVYWLYGMRGAARGWEDECKAKLVSIGFVAGKAAPTVLVNIVEETRVVVHGDDFTFLGPEKYLREVASAMSEWYELKVRGIMGPEVHDLKKIDILNRTVEWRSDAIVYKADPKHAKIIVEALGLDNRSNESNVPGKTSGDDDNEADYELDKTDSRAFRALTARANYLSMDRPDIQYSVKELCHVMSKPRQSSWAKLKQLARYLKGKMELEFLYKFQDEPREITVMVDGDWAGCRTTRKSTSGGFAFLGAACVKTWSSTQGSVALSSGEAEYYGIMKGCTEVLGLKSLMNDLGWEVSAIVTTDSTAANGIGCRQGAGRIKHIETRFLWLQEAVARGRLHLQKIPRAVNCADILTKYVSLNDVMRFGDMYGWQFVCKEDCVMALRKIMWADLEDSDFGVLLDWSV